MAHDTSSIDDILLNSNPSHLPQSPEVAAEIEESEKEPDIPLQNVSHETSESNETQSDEYGASEEAPKVEAQKEIDEYGNEKAAAKLYTEEEVNDRINRTIRDRFARMEKNGQQAPTQAQVQQQTQQGFNYDAESNESWQQQLESFIEQTLTKRTQREAQQAYQAQEQRAMEEFETRFQNGVEKFKDFREVTSNQPITNPMMMATRSLKDPAAFIYAASKRAPQELQRIANLADPYAQMVEIGKLEERMKQSKPSTKAPKPVGRTPEDSPIAHKSDRQPTIEELIAKDEAKRRAKFNQRRR